MPDKGLRIGLLCESMHLQRWQIACLRHLLAVPGVTIAVVVLRQPEEGPALKPKRRWATLLYRRWRDGAGQADAMKSEDASALLGQAPLVKCRTELQKGAEHFIAPDLEKIRAYSPDVLLRFGFNIIKGGVLELPRYGVWSFHHGDEMHYRGGPPGLWEIMDDEPVTGAVLQRLTEKLDGGRILRKGAFKTIDHSLGETVGTVLMHSAHWPAQVCRELLAGNQAAADGRSSTTKAPVNRYPGNIDFLRFRWKMAMNKMRFHRAQMNMHEEWNIGVLPHPISVLVQDEPQVNVRWLPPPAEGQYRADPFGYEMDGRLNVLYEKFDQETGNASIARLRPKRDGDLKRSRTMLEMAGHLSYPFVIEYEGRILVVPEQADTGCVELYALSAENEALVPECVLLEEPLIDPTLFPHQGRWWLFGTKAPLTGTELFVYYSDRLEGPYIAHRQNPVKSDIRSARPAGTPFTVDGELWRPGQDCSRTYGGRVALNRVTELSPELFAEETVKFIGPFKGSWDKGMHTISAVGDVTLVDGKRFITDERQRSRVRKRKLDKLMGRPEKG
ncbi:MAG: glucosamine inositolphosphorylceramide transferase family protein [Flavobacteriales bacterium]